MSRMFERVEAVPDAEALQYNPFSQEAKDDPYPFYAALRRDHPVYQFGPFHMVFRYDDVLHVLKNHALFSSTGMGQTSISDRPTKTVINTDPPDHTRLRNLVNRAFTPRMIDALEPRIREITRGLVDAIVEKAARSRGSGFNLTGGGAGQDHPRFDLIADLAIPLPVTIIAELLGVEPERRDDFKRWSDLIVAQVGVTAISSEELAAIDEELSGFQEYFAAAVEDRRSHRGDDLISALVAAHEDNEALSADEVLAFTALLLIAGNETTTNLLGNLVLSLLRNPDQLAKLQEDPSLISNAVEESLRYDAPVQMLFRTAMEDCEIAGVPVPGGAMVVPVFASANRDERRYPDPERFDITRDTQGHTAFGHGIHFCLGAPLARLEGRIALEALLPLLPSMRLGEERPPRLDAFFLRGLKRLPLSLHAAAAREPAAWPAPGVP